MQKLLFILYTIVLLQGKALSLCLEKPSDRQDFPYHAVPTGLWLGDSGDTLHIFQDKKRGSYSLFHGHIGEGLIVLESKISFCRYSGKFFIKLKSGTHIPYKKMNNGIILDARTFYKAKLEPVPLRPPYTNRAPKGIWLDNLNQGKVALFIFQTIKNGLVYMDGIPKENSFLSWNRVKVVYEEGGNFLQWYDYYASRYDSFRFELLPNEFVLNGESFTPAVVRPNPAF